MVISFVVILLWDQLFQEQNPNAFTLLIGGEIISPGLNNGLIDLIVAAEIPGEIVVSEQGRENTLTKSRKSLPTELYFYPDPLLCFEWDILNHHITALEWE